MERENINVNTIVNPDGTYTMTLDSVSYNLITHAMVQYQKQLESSNRWADKKRGSPKKVNFKPRPNITFNLIETHRSSSNYTFNQEQKAT